MSCSRPCRECPWVNTNRHSIKFRKYFEKMRSLGKIENHKCHMVSNDVWNYEEDLTDKNICRGSKLNI